MVANWIGLPKDPTEHDRQSEAWFNELTTEVNTSTALAEENETRIGANVNDIGDLQDTQTAGIVFQPGWGDNGGAFVVGNTYKTGGSVVHLEGLLRRTGAGLPGNTHHHVFTLPVGSRPASTHIFNVIYFDIPLNREYLARMDVRADGVVTARSLNGFASWLSVSGVSFRVA